MQMVAILCAMLAVTGVSREPETGKRWSWEGRHAQFLETIAANGEKPYDIVFLGDSLTELMTSEPRGNREVFEEFYGGLNTLNLGIRGDRIENLVWRLEHGELDGYRARLFRILIGTNNVPKRWTAEEICAGVRQIAEMVAAKHPEAKIEIVSILPRDDRKCPRDGMERIRNANRLLAGICDGEKVVLVDASAKFLDERGLIKMEFYTDGLHLSPDGYRTLFAEGQKPN